MRYSTAALVVLFLVCAPAAASDIEVSVDPGSFSWVEVAPGTYRGELPTARSARIPGALDLPVIPVRIQAPPGFRLESANPSVEWSSLPAAPGEVARYRADAASAPRPAPPLVRVLPGGYARGEARDGIVINPVQPDGQGGYRLATRIVLDLTFTPETVAPVRPLRRPLALGAPGTRSEPERFSPRHRPSLDGSPVSYVIVAPEAFVEAFEPLALWRTQTGTPAVIRTMEWITQTYSGVDEAERLRNFIREAVTYWGVEYVLLGGDVGWVPMRYATTTFYGGAEIPSDLYFQCLDGTWNANGNGKFGEAAEPTDQADILPDVWLGRAPARSPEDVQVFVNKVLSYERGEHEAPQSAAIMAEVLFPKNWTPEGGTYIDGATLGEAITATLEASDFDVTRLYENNVPYPGALPETLDTVIDVLEAGPAVALHVGHGSYLSMSVGLGGRTLTRPVASALTNGANTFFLYSVNCTSAALDFDAIAKHFLLNPNGGAFGCVGSTRFDFPGASDPYDRGFFDFAVTQKLTLGQAVAVAKEVEYELALLESADRWTVLTIVLLSDPAVRLWSEAPRTLAVNHADTAVQGDVLSVQVEVSGGGPLAGATVVLHEPGGLWASALTDAAGAAQITAASADTGEVTLTVVGPGLVPYQAAVRLLSQEQSPLPVVTATKVAGREDACVLAGAAESVTWSLINRGGMTLSGINVAVQGPWTFTPVSGPTSLAPGVTGDYVFSVEVPEDLPDLETVPVVLAIAGDQGSWDLASALHSSAPVLGVYGLERQEDSGNGDGLPDPGEEFDLSLALINVGTGPAPAGQLTLEAVAGAQVVQAEAPLGAIEAGDTTSASGLRVLVQSQPVRLRALLDGRVVADSLDLVPPEPPGLVGISGGTHSIQLTWDPSPSTDVARYVLLSASAEEGPYTRVSQWGQSPSGLFVDGPLPELTVRYYRIAAQDRSGNLSSFTAPVRATTGLAQESGFPQECGAETGTSPVMADLDGDGTLELITGGDEIYVLHADGSELLDGDDDVRTNGPFSKVGGEVGFFASPAVGDLDGDGRLEVVGVMAKAGLLYVWDSKGVVQPGWPVLVETYLGTAWVQSSPTLLDFDGDGDLEIALYAGEALVVFHHTGEEFADGDANPSSRGVFFRTGDRFTYTSPAARDLDGDGKDELIMASRGGRLHVLREDASSWPGFPLTFGGELTSSPAVADLDGDQVPEIILATGGQNTPGPDSLEVRRLDGTALPGWPQAILVNQDISSSPAVADWDGDGDLEVCAVSGNTTVYVWNADGTPVPGFPRQFLNSLGHTMSARGSAAVQNLDADPFLEAAFTNQDGWLYAVNLDGSLVEGFPIKHEGGIEGCPLIADLDGDGFNELCVTGLDARINLYQTPGLVSPRRGWPMFQGNPRHNGDAAFVFENTAPLALTLSVLQSPHLPGQAATYFSSTIALAKEPVMLLDGNPVALTGSGSDPPLFRAVLDLSPGRHSLEVDVETVYGIQDTAQRDFEVLALSPSPEWVGSVHGVHVYGGGAGLLMVAPGRGTSSDAPAGSGVKVLVGPPGTPVPEGTLVRFDLPEEWPHAGVQGWNGRSWEDVGIVADGGSHLTTAPGSWGWFRVLERDRPPVVRARLQLGPPVPNPTAGGTSLSLSLSHSGRVRVTVFDLQGRRIRRLEEGAFEAGPHRLWWDGADDAGHAVPAGVYFLRVRGGETQVVRRIVRLSGGAP